MSGWLAAMRIDTTIGTTMGTPTLSHPWRTDLRPYAVVLLAVLLGHLALMALPIHAGTPSAMAHGTLLAGMVTPAASPSLLHMPAGMHTEPATPDSPPTPDCQLEPALLRAGPLLSSLAGVLLALLPPPRLIAVAAAQALVQPPRPLQRGDPQALLQVFRN